MQPLCRGARLGRAGDLGSGRWLAAVAPENDDLVTREVAALTVHTPRKEIRRRVRRQLMLRRLQRELADGRDINTVLRRPFPK
jgi:hypothetical protein